ncbi:MAG: glucoamylase family protein, partial [Lysobacter sp.]
PYIRAGLERAGFKGGWLAPAQGKGKDGDKDKKAAEEAKPVVKPAGTMDPATARALGEAESRAGRTNAPAKQNAPKPE